jgi:hypothetical protein
VEKVNILLYQWNSSTLSELDTSKQVAVFDGNMWGTIYWNNYFKRWYHGENEPVRRKRMYICWFYISDVVK